ncbi:polysaccharide biosynthesis C-terminal domain-containing protein [Pseudobacteroides cellulosolvens]|uniref:polysaccharide biosynthesis C-terminal domain-containing protein n=1 Tax=Pseudobacteroides cellulosolvens TaxID=35825 RepID=UPI0005618B90|nr:WxcM-like domain-containing protein [Pseudobacteroides cellulosolvens]
MDTRFEFISINPFRDKRGSLKKIAMKSRIGTEIEEVYVLYSNKGAVRGNHYHKETSEYFSVLEGTAFFSLKDLETEDFETVKISSDDNIIVKVPVNVVHAFKNDTDQPMVMLAVSSREYNPDDDDTYPMVILQ